MHHTYDPSKASMFKAMCTKCNAFVSTSSKHCSTCNRCTAEYDHHCNCVNNCIGQKNFKSYIYMIVCFALSLALSVLVESFFLSSTDELAHIVWTDITLNIIVMGFLGPLIGLSLIHI